MNPVRSLPLPRRHWFRVGLGALASLAPLQVGAAQAQAPATATPVAHALRLRPGDDLRAALFAYATTQRLRAAAVVSCAGSLKQATIRFANQPEGAMVPGPLEIVSLSGTLEATGGHLHVAVSDGTGRTIGGHLMVGCTIYTTAEVILLELPSLEFRRERDAVTTFDELVIRRR